jgi:N-acetyl sugar amidotransferase
MTEFKQCNVCIMDNLNDPDIVFSAEGICNHCFTFDAAMQKLPKESEREKKLQEIIKKIKEEGKNKKYDCLLGISGGVDSSYLAYLCGKYKLRPYIIHFDNGWNSELAVKNIETILRKLNFDLETDVIDWEEFKDLQLSYFKAGVVDLEIPTDLAMISAMFNIGRKHNIKYILSGHNIATEGTKMPNSWVHDKLDYRNLKDIHKQYGKVPLKTLPKMGFLKRLYYSNVVKFEYIQLLNLIDYNKEKAKQTLRDELGWRDYGGKHFESVFTRFYQGHILPKKFNIDKRVFHYSCLIKSKQMTREQALELMKLPVYDPAMLEADKEFVFKKLGFTENSFNEYLKAPIRKHGEFKMERSYWDMYFKFVKIAKIILFRK